MREHARLAPHAKLDCEVAWRAHRAALNRSNVMLHNVKELEGALVEAVDGQLGTVKDLYFDDKRWAIRYMVVETGTWLKGRKVLISPNAVHRVAWDDGVMHMSLTQQQVRDSPCIATDKPVSRQQEAAHHNYYGYPNYWDGINLWGLAAFPIPWVGASPDPSLAPHGLRDDAVARVDRLYQLARARSACNNRPPRGREESRVRYFACALAGARNSTRRALQARRLLLTRPQITVVERRGSPASRRDGVRSPAIA